MSEKTPVSEETLDATLHQPIRTRIVAYLAGRGETTFMDLKRALEISDGNLDSHLKKLLTAEYITTRKDTGKARQQTLYLLTESGRAAFCAYLDSLQKLLGVRLKGEKSAGETADRGALGDDKLGWHSS